MYWTDCPHPDIEPAGICMAHDADSIRLVHHPYRVLHPGLWATNASKGHRGWLYIYCTIINYYIRKSSDLV